jgi:flagellar hook-associated protein 1
MELCFARKDEKVSVSGLLNIARDAIASNQIAINITGANIANVNTPGYTRQRAEFNAISSVDVSSGRADFGVRVDSIERLYNRYLETQIVDQAQKVGYDEARQEILGRVEGVFNESGGSGLSDSLSQFWNSWEALSSDPTSQVARYSVVSAASNLASLFRENSNVLGTVQQDIQDSMASAVEDINSITADIAILNKQILASGMEDGSGNNLLDSRMELVKGLADKINISYYENNDGTLSVFLANGNILVGGSSSEQLSVRDGNVTFQNDATVLNGVITSGRLGAMIEMGEETVSSYLDNMNQLADGIVKAVNDLHTVGWVCHDVIDAPIPAEGHVNLYTGDVSSGGDFTGVVNKTYAMKITTAGAFGVAKYQISTDGGQSWGAETLTDVAVGVISLGDGVSLTFTDFNDATKPLVKDDIFYVTAYPPGYYKDIGAVFFDDRLTGAKNMQVSADILADPQKIAASVKGNDGFIDDPIPAAGNTYAGVVSSGGVFTGDINMPYAMKIIAGGAFGVATYKISTDGGLNWGTEKTTVAGDGVISLGDGVSLTFNEFGDATKPLVADDIIYVNAYPPADFFNARLIGAVRDNLSMDGGASTFNDYYASLVGRVGFDVKAVDGSIERNTAVTNQLTARREGVSGVSLDEEVINLMKYQFGYNVAGRLAKTANDILDVLMALGQ